MNDATSLVVVEIEGRRVSLTDIAIVTPRSIIGSGDMIALLNIGIVAANVEKGSLAAMKCAGIMIVTPIAIIGILAKKDITIEAVKSTIGGTGMSQSIGLADTGRVLPMRSTDA